MAAQKYVVLSVVENLASFTSRIQVDENSYYSVDTEAELDEALAAGRHVHVRGEGSEGVIDCTTPKVLVTNCQKITGPGVLRFTLAPVAGGPANPRGITVHADDVMLENFELTGAGALASNICYGLALSEGAENHGHRMVLRNMVIHDWQRGISKDGSVATTSHDDVLIDRCFVHTIREYGAYLNFGFNRLVVRDSRFLNWLVTAPGGITTENAFYGGTNWRDCVVENCYFGNASRMGFEATKANYDYYHERTRVVMCKAENCGSMGFSLGFCVGGFFSLCKAKDVVQCGFEIAGRVVGNPAHNPAYESQFAQGCIESCEVDGVTRAAAGCYGISLDGVRDTMVRGATKVQNIVSSVTQGDVGIGMTDCERVTVQGVLIEDGGYVGIQAHGVYLPNTSGLHDVANNVIRNPAGYAGGDHRAIRIIGQGAHVRYNNAFQKAGTTLSYESRTVTPGARVYVDGVAVAYSADINTGVAFTGTNVILPG